MKKSLIQLAFNPCFNPFLHSTTGTLYPGFGYPFRHYWVTTYISRVTHSVIELFTLTYSIERTAFVVLNWKRSLFFALVFFWGKKKILKPSIQLLQRLSWVLSNFFPELNRKESEMQWEKSKSWMSTYAKCNGENFKYTHMYY